uniref:Thioredoxin domain-containing protein n=1 Tax=Bionectria ochroleuca TaxID=29856 RepID=A0A8H7NI58_BIOOC
MASSPVVDIKSKAQFDELISKTPYVAIQAHATCDSFTFARFDTDEVPDLSFELGIRSIPAFFSFENAEKGQGLKLVEELAGKSKAEGGESAAAPAEPAPAPAPVEEKKPEEFSTKEDF